MKYIILNKKDEFFKPCESSLYEDQWTWRMEKAKVYDVKIDALRDLVRLNVRFREQELPRIFVLDQDFMDELKEFVKGTARL